MERKTNAALDSDKESENEDPDGTSQGLDQASTSPRRVLVGPRQVHTEYKMHTYRTIYMLVQHGRAGTDPLNCYPDNL